MITNQAYLFFVFIINGILIGLIFDLFRISRKVIKTNNLMTYIEDFIFWILTGFIVLYSIFVFNNGELRLFMFIGIILGVIIYTLLMSKYFIKINMKIINTIKSIIKILFKPINFVFVFLRKIFMKSITFLFINIRKNFTNFSLKMQNTIQKSQKKAQLKPKICKKLKI